MTAADYSTQQAPPALTAGADAEPPEPIHGTRRKCQQTRRPAGRVIPATGQDTADKPRQGRPGVVTQRSPTLDCSPSPFGSAWTAAPHPPAPPFHPAALFFKKRSQTAKKTCPVIKQDLTNNQGGKNKFKTGWFAFRSRWVLAPLD